MTEIGFRVTQLWYKHLKRTSNKRWALLHLEALLFCSEIVMSRGMSRYSLSEVKLTKVLLVVGLHAILKPEDTEN